MAHPLDSAYFKLHRASEHLNQLEAEVNVFHDANPYVTYPRYDFNAPEHTVRLRVLGEPPRQLGLLFADAMHNARCALDHLVYQLADLDRDHPRGEKTQYPICDTDTIFDAQPSGYLQGVPGPYRARLREAQPYNPRYSRLAAIRDLDNRDKHRVLETIVVDVHSVDIQVNPPIRGWRPSDDVPSEDNAILGWFQSDVRVDMKMKITYRVAFGMKGGPRLGIGASKEALRQVAEILGRFRDAFD